MSIHPDITLATSTKADGNLSFKWGPEGEVLDNRGKFLEKLNIKPEDCIVMEVEHKDEIIVIDASNKNRTGKETVVAEALITTEENLPLFLLTADCLPISFFDPEKQVIALAHLGWKPTNELLTQKVVKKMQREFGSNPENILAYIGPGIHKESYIFLDPIQKTLTAWQPFLVDLPSGETQIDLPGYNKAQLLEVALREENIIIDPVDTATSLNYFSHYRSVRTGEVEGRFATLICLKK